MADNYVLDVTKYPIDAPPAAPTFDLLVTLEITHTFTKIQIINTFDVDIKIKFGDAGETLTNVYVAPIKIMSIWDDFSYDESIYWQYEGGNPPTEGYFKITCM